MAATPIPIHLVETVFQYIFPPALPLPTHLLSKPLIKRHHFLGISPSEPLSYLSWPSPQSSQVAEALELASPEASLSQPEHDVRYSAPDQETLLAHVRPHGISNLQIVFAWDLESETWGYHDIRMLPFPEGSLSSLEATLTQRPRIIPSLQLPPSDLEETPRGTGSSSPSSDNFWAGYDSSGSSPTSPRPVNGIAEDEENAEAAYWASYGAVHGSGDSTVPSPAPEKRRVQSQKQGDLRGPDIPTDPLITHLHLRLHEHNGLLSPRLYSTQSEHPGPPLLSVTVEEPELGPSTALVDRKSELVNPERSISQRATEDAVGPVEPSHPEKITIRREVDEGVKDAVRGIYRMWRAHTSSADVGRFLEVVKSALELEKS